MRLARVLGAIGRGLISAGVIVLLFVAYQLWGTGLQHSAAQSDLESELEELFESDAVLEARQVLADAEVAAASQPADTDDGVAESGETDGTDDSETADDDSDNVEPAVESAQLVEPDFSALSAEFIAAVYPAPGDKLARLVMPTIDVDQITVEGVSVEDLRRGPGHYNSTPMPGQAGNSAIAGHRTTYGAPFHRVDELQPGDPIIVTSALGTFEYRVTENVAPDGSIKGHFIVSPSDTWVLGQDTGKNLLTLTACHPKFSARQRIIVQAELVGEPVPTIPRDEATELPAVTISAGEADEVAAAEEGLAAGSMTEEATDTDVVISDEVAADDDPSVDAEGNPIDIAEADSVDDSELIETAEGADVAAVEDTQAVADTSEEAVEADDDLISVDDIAMASAEVPIGTEEDDFGEGLNGDRTRIRPAIMWGIAAAFIWLTAWFVGMRLNRKWAVYAVGLIPFALVLWSSFVNIDQALPSY